MDIQAEYPELFADMPTSIEEAKKLLTGSRSILRNLHPIDRGDLNLTNIADEIFLSEMQLLSEFIKSVSVLVLTFSKFKDNFYNYS